MVTDPQKTVDIVSNWIREQVLGAGQQACVVGLSGGADSALVALLCLRTGLPTYCVKMPCQSSHSSLQRANELLGRFPDLKSVTIELGAAFTSISRQATLDVYAVVAGQEEDALVEGMGAAEASLRSCLRAPTLDFVAKLVGGLIIGTGNRDEDEMIRYYQKRGDGAVDISPIAKLHKSEVYELLRFLGCPLSIIDAKPSADLLGPDSGQTDEDSLRMTYPEIEWGTRMLVDLMGEWDRPDLSNDTLMHQMFTARQVWVLRTLDQMERTSRHKAQPPPVCQIRNRTDTVV